MAEEEDEVAVGMEKGFMDEFFEQVGSVSAPDSSLLLFVFDLLFTSDRLMEFTHHKQK